MRKIRCYKALQQHDTHTLYISSISADVEEITFLLILFFIYFTKSKVDKVSMLKKKNGAVHMLLQMVS